MPKATVSKEAIRYDLETLEGGYVNLVPLSYRQKLRRQEIATGSLGMKADDEGDAEMLMSIMQVAVAEFEFDRCIVDHNLEDENGTPLNFASPHTLEILDPRVGDEISSILDKLNNFDPDSEEGKLS